MKSLLPGETKGYVVRKMAKDVVVGDILFITWHVLHVKEIILHGRTMEFVSASESIAGIGSKTFLTCIQKEDPTIQLNIEAKLEVLRKNKITSKKKRIGHEMYDRAEYYNSDPHSWAILETSGKYEYWKDVNHGLRVLWKDNDIIGVDEEIGGGSPLMMTTKDNVIVIDKHYFNLSKYIWE